MKIPTGGTARKPLARAARFGEIPKPTVKEETPQSGWEKARLIWTIYVPPEENPSGGIFILLLACMCLAEQRE